MKSTNTVHNVKLAMASTLLLGSMRLVAQVPAVPAAEAAPTKQPVRHSLYFVDLINLPVLFQQDITNIQATK